MNKLENNLKIYNELGIIEKVEGMIVEYFSKVIRAVESLNTKNNKKQEMLDYLNLIIGRESIQKT